MNRKLASAIILGVIAGTLFLYVNSNKWNRYYKNKLYQPPRELIQRAALSFEKPGKAIDLGCGVGNEAVFLLNMGWQVWAIDSQRSAIQLLQNRKDLAASEKLVPLLAKFDNELDWEKLPLVDFVYASCSLPFCQSQDFLKVWNQMKEKVLPGGRIASHFFGCNYQGFSDREKSEMTFLTRKDVESLFEDFEIEYFQEHEEDGESGTGQAIHSHIFEVIAIKD